MPLDVKIPPMGESISSGILAKWHVKNGDAVKRDQALFELETDKITSEGTADAAGTITLKVEAGAEVKIGQVVATIETGAAAATPAEKPAAPAPKPAAEAAPQPKAAAAPASAIQSPAVRRLAAETGVNPAEIAGTGKAGRVTKGDMLSAGEKPVPVPAAPAPAAPPAVTQSGERQTRRKLTPLRQRIAERLVSAQHLAALLTTFNEVDMSGVMALRSKYQEDFVKKNGLKLGFMSFFVKAVVHALREVPAINTQIEGDTLVQNHFYDIGVAVSTEKGLMVPVIRNCDSLGMASIERAITDAAGKAREGKITLADLEGGVFTITNGGTFGSLLSTPIINPPQSAILGMHAINDRPVAVGGQVVIRPMMYIALTYDHRLVDGREAVTFLVKVKQQIEDPSRLLSASDRDPMDTYDVAVIGAGPGGYVCAFRAAQLGLKVALIDRRATLGGTCLNVGCIPSKALLHSSEQLVFARDHAKDHGINVGEVSADIAALLRRKDAVVAKLVGGVALLAKARKVTVIRGEAAFTSPTSLSVKGAEGNVSVSAKNYVIATGSAPVELPFMKFDGKTVVSSDEAIAFDKVPSSLVVVGGGAIGLELGSVWARLGSSVTVVEFLPKIVAAYDDDVVRTFSRLLQKQGLKIEVGAKVTGLRADGGRAVLTAEREGKTLEFPADKVLVAVGRRPYTEGLGLDKAGVKLDDKRRVAVDEKLRTGVPGIWAIGDVVAGPMLAHKAEEDGAAVAEWIAGKAGHVDWNLVPAIVYTDPEVASVGLGEDAAKAASIAVNIGRFNFAANGRAIANDSTDGFVKVVADATTDRILGAQIIGRGAGEMIAEVVTHMEYGGSAEDLGRTIHAHPTMSEALKEAGLAVSKSAIHAI